MEWRAVVEEGNVGGLCVRGISKGFFADDVIEEDRIPFVKERGAHDVEIFVAEVGVPSGNEMLIFHLRRVAHVKFDADVEEELEARGVEAVKRVG